MSAPAQDISEDKILGGRLTLRQPLEGYRVAIDPIFLAAAVPVRENESVLDVGSGVGAASLCLLQRVPECRVVGLEVQRSLVRLAGDNIVLNNMRGRAEVLNGNLIQPPPRLAASSFHHVMTNPPYGDPEHGKPCLLASKTMANQASEYDLSRWVNFCLLMTQPKGTVTFIYRADRLHSLLTQLHGKLGNLVVFPLWPSHDKPAKRVIVQGQRNADPSMRLDAGMVLHTPNGTYTQAAEDILRRGKGLMLL